ncbi:MAG: hypothetical protein ACLFV5_07405 [Anaerolineales bacterium]
MVLAKDNLTERGAIAIIADALDRICTERLKPGLPQMAKRLAVLPVKLSLKEHDSPFPVRAGG